MSKATSADKKSTADAVIKVLVPHFKSGKVASKQVFKFMAREMTHVFVERGIKADGKFFGKYMESFFCSNAIVYSEDDARSKIRGFEASPEAQRLFRKVS